MKFLLGSLVFVSCLLLLAREAPAVPAVLCSATRPGQDDPDALEDSLEGRFRCHVSAFGDGSINIHSTLLVLDKEGG
jgi:hypothetical protein